MKTLIISTILIIISSLLLATYAQSNESQSNNKQHNSLYIALDNSGSMKNKFEWISQTLADLNQQLLNHKNMPYHIKLFSFSNQSQLLAQGDVDAILAAIQTIDKGQSKEDGLLPISHILEQQAQNAHILLFTDEAQSPSHEVKLNQLIEQIKQQNITVHVIVKNLAVELDQQIIGVEGFNIALKDPITFNRTINQLSEQEIQDYYSEKFAHFCQIQSQPALCKNTRSGMRIWLTYLGVEDSEYIQLAFASGGTVWDIDRIKANQNYFTDYISKAVTNRLQNHLYDSRVTVTGDTLSGEIKPNQLITFEANKNQTLMKTHQVEQWLWDFDGDGNIDDQGPTVTTQFNQSGLHKVKLWTVYDSVDHMKQMRVVRVLVTK